MLARNALFQKENTLFSVETFKTMYCFEGCSIINAIKLQKLWVKIHNAHMPVFSITRPDGGFP